MTVELMGTKDHLTPPIPPLRFYFIKKINAPVGFNKFIKTTTGGFPKIMFLKLI